MGFLGPTYEWWGAVSIQPTFFLYQGINDTYFDSIVFYMKWKQEKLGIVYSIWTSFRGLKEPLDISWVEYTWILEIFR